MVRGLDIGVKASTTLDSSPTTGFIFQGGGTNICGQSMLETATGDWDLSRMKGTDINLYQHVARGLNGGDYFIIKASSLRFGSVGGSRSKGAFQCRFDDEILADDFNGTTYEQLPAKVVDSPYEGDSVLRHPVSWSAVLPVEKTAVRSVMSSAALLQSGKDNYDIDISKEVARVCISGARRTSPLTSVSW